MKQVKLVNNTFSGDCTNFLMPCSQMRWHKVRHEDVTPDDLVVYTNLEFAEALKHPVRKRVAWLLESRGIAWWTYEFIEDNLEAFDVVFTYDDHIVDLDPRRCVFIPRGGCWIKPGDHRIFKKSRLVSFMSSDKGFGRWYATGHLLRPSLHKILKSKGGFLGSSLERAGIREKIDIYGTVTGQHIEYKLPALQEYMFHISVENMIHDAYFTEKVIDCFVTGTVPIFRGTRQIDRFFNPEGIIFFDGLEELVEILINLNDEDYFRRMEAVRENFELAMNFLMPEDWMCAHTGLLTW